MNFLFGFGRHEAAIETIESALNGNNTDRCQDSINKTFFHMMNDPFSPKYCEYTNMKM